MALNVEKGVLTLPASATNPFDLTLPANFDPKAIILWTTQQTAAGFGANADLAMGFATYHGAAVQQVYWGVFSTDALATTSTARMGGTTACLKQTSSSTAITVALEVRLVSMTTGSGSKITFNVVTTLNGAKVHYMALGGSDLTDAYAATLSLAASPQSVTIVAGFGQPDLLLFGLRGGYTLADSAAANAQIGFSAAASDTVRQEAMLALNSAATAVALGTVQKQKAITTLVQGGLSVNAEGDLSARGSWPTDGYQVTWSTAGTAGWIVPYLALKGTFQTAIGVATVPTAGGTPVTQDIAAGFAPAGALLFHRNLAAAATVDTTSTDLGYFGVGGTDGTTAGHSNIGDDDAATDSVSKKAHTETKAIQFHKPTGTLAQNPTLTSEADSAFSGTNLRLSWTTIDTVAREFAYVIVGSAPSTATPPKPTIIGQAVTRAASW